MFILLPLLCRLSARNRTAVGLVLAVVGLLLIIDALAHVIALIVVAMFLVGAGRGRRRERLT